MKVIFSILAFFVIQNLTFNAKVIGVVDGDTIVVLKQNNTQEKIRFEGIDCPESNQDFGELAKQTTVYLCFQKYVHIIQTGKDRYGRILANVYVDEICINKELLKCGMAWHFKKYNCDPELAQLEIEARERKIGLWSQSNPISPWDFRAMKN